MDYRVYRVYQVYQSWRSSYNLGALGAHILSESSRSSDSVGVLTELTFYQRAHGA